MIIVNERRLGASDIAAVAAHYYPYLPPTLTKYGNVRDVYERIVNGIHSKQNKLMARGLAAEPVIRQIYRQKVGEVQPLAHPTIVQHEDHAFATASPDDLAVDGQLVEYKSVGFWAERAAWTAKTYPDRYALQVQWAMEVCGLDRCRLFAAFGQDYPNVFVITHTRCFPVERDREICRLLLVAGRRFWNEHVEPRSPPAVEPINNKRAIKALYKQRKAA